MSSVERAGHAMNASLRREFKRIHALLQSGPETVELRHQVGLLVVAVKRDPELYGKQAVALVAAALGRDEATLYRFAQVASRWTEPEIAAWTARARAAKSPLSWWHFVEASAVARKRDRDELLGRAVAEGLSVRALARITTESGRSRRAANQLVREAEAIARRVAVLKEGWGRLRAACDGERGTCVASTLIGRASVAVGSLVSDAEATLVDVNAIASRADLSPAASTRPRS